MLTEFLHILSTHINIHDMFNICMINKRIRNYLLKSDIWFKYVKKPENYSSELPYLIAVEKLLLENHKFYSLKISNLNQYDLLLRYNILEKLYDNKNYGYLYLNLYNFLSNKNSSDFNQFSQSENMYLYIYVECYELIFQNSIDYILISDKITLSIKNIKQVFNIEKYKYPYKNLVHILYNCFNNKH